MHTGTGTTPSCKLVRVDYEILLSRLRAIGFGEAAKWYFKFFFFLYIISDLFKIEPALITLNKVTTEV